MPKYTLDEFQTRLAGMRSVMRVKIRLDRPIQGGQAAGEKGLHDYVKHVLKLEDGTPEFAQALSRIKGEEIGERDITPEGGEVEEKKVYAIKVIRSKEHGPFLLDHQIRAALKQAASRIGIFVAKSRGGAKGAVSEMGDVRACGESLQNPDRPWEIYLRKDGAPAKTYYETERGCVSSPKGKMSIQTEAEHCEEGATIEFEILWQESAKGFSAEDMLNSLAAMMAVGLGSGLSQGHGKITVLEAEHTAVKWVPDRGPKGEKKGKKEKDEEPAA